MKSTRHDGSDLRRVLCGMITDPVVCSRIAGQWRDGGLFGSRWANLVGGWCVDHQRKYGQPLDGQLRAIYEQWAAGREVDQETAAAVERLLAHLSDEHEREGPPPSDYLLDMAGRVCNRVRVAGLVEEATELLEAGQVEDAHAKLASVSRVELGVGSMIRTTQEFAPWAAAFDPERRRPLVVYPDGLGRFFGDALARGSLVAFMGPDKSTKSFWVMDVAYRAMRARLRVAYFDAGDMLQDEVLLRLGCRATGRPLEPCNCRWPTGFDEQQNPTWETRSFATGLTSREAYRAIKRLSRGRDVFRVSCHSNSSLTVAGIDATLRDWEREGWTADVIAIDYADIMAPPSGVRETLDQVDETWKQLRRMSQERHALVVTASQSNAAAYADKQGGTLGRKHFSGRKTKLAHVNGMVGINYTDEDVKRGVCRLNWVVRRSAKFRSGRVVTVAGCLDVARPSIISVF